MTDVVMYHYIRDPDPAFPHLRHMTPDAFDRQLAWLKRYHRDFDLTFDDGLRDHMLAADIMERHGLRGTFFVCSQPLTEGRMLDVHRIHVLDAKLGGTFTEVVHDAWSGERVEWPGETYTLQHGNKYAKHLLNYEVSPAERGRILDALELQYGAPPSVSDWYMDEGQIRELHERGHTIGTHTHSHPVLSRLSRLRQLGEIRDAIHFVRTVIGEQPEVFAYPYGGRASYNDDTLEAVHRHVTEGFDVRDESWVPDGMAEQGGTTIPRRDCATFPEAV